MNPAGTTHVSHGKFLHAHRIFTLFKYTIYILLAWNAFLFFQEDFAASAQTFGDDISWRNFVEAFSATIDTVAWIVLLLLFELETAVIPDEKLKGGLKWLLMAVRVLAYFFIVYAFYGYWAKFGVITDLVPFELADVCSLAGMDWNYVADLDDYPPLNQAACASLQGQELYRIAGRELVGSAAALRSALGLAIIDIVNAGTWLIIVVLLEVEVFLQLKNVLTDRMLRVGKYLKGFFYLVLFVCAAYWGVEGSFLDFWDAFLWLVAFIFIELNIFRWHGETEEQQEMTTAS
ncbi:MAG: hypothetical protein RQ826_05245 [Xanthomonadales bacterium]|nr:hypothetical protein [Xanthomonadales bacterium]